MSKIKILIIDDEDGFFIKVSRFLKSKNRNYEPIHAKNRNDAFLIINQQIKYHIDIIILDLNFEGDRKLGISILKELKREKINNDKFDIPILIASQKDNNEEEAYIIGRLGVAAYLRKQDNNFMTKLREKIEDVLEQKEVTKSPQTSTAFENFKQSLKSKAPNRKVVKEVKIELRKELEILLSKSKHMEALDLEEEFFNIIKDTQNVKYVISFKRKYNDLNKKLADDSMSYEAYNIGITRLDRGILGLLDD